MTHEQIIDYCLQKKGAFADFPFDSFFPVIKVKAPLQEKGRIFAQVFYLRGEPMVTLNCTPQTAEYYRNKYPHSVTRGYHCPPVQQPHFNTISLDGSVSDDEILKMIDYSYETVVAKFPKYVQKRFDK